MSSPTPPPTPPAPCPSNAPVVLSLKRVSVSHTHCFVNLPSCNKQVRDPRAPSRPPKPAFLVSVPVKERARIFAETKIFISEKSVICPHHLNDDESIVEEALAKLPDCVIDSTSEVTPDGIVQLLHHLADISQRKDQAKSYFQKMDDAALQVYTGRTVAEVKQLVQMTQASPFDICIYLTYLFKGTGVRLLAEMIGILKSTAQRHIARGRKALVFSLPPTVLRPRRQELEDEISQIAKTMYFPDGHRGELVTIWDGTYIYHQKSSNFRFQRKTFTAQKMRNLLKPMVCVTTTGRFIDIDCCWSNEVNDAAILKQIMEKDWFKDTFRPGDVFVLDRGFRDVVAALEERGFRVVMPEFLKRGQKQFESRQSNSNRMCTKVRWVIEARNHTMKRYNSIGTTLDNKSIMTLADDLQIITCITNLFEPRLYSDGDDENIAERILAVQSKENELMKLVTEMGLVKKPSNFKSLTETREMNDVPELNSMELKKLAGNYCLNLAKSYFFDHLWGAGSDFKVSVAKEAAVVRSEFTDRGILVRDPLLIKGRVQSRHSNGKSYASFVLYDKSVRGFESIRGYFCQCKTGARTTDPCAHSLCIIWYLSYGRYDTDLKQPAAFLNLHFPKGKPTLVQEESGDEDDVPVQDNE
uniref:uncharacterized protein LOC117610900 n=1 Tax=Osmia lignaria TaxID=473952 RepID=UPI00147835B5|nr:uncharacterized protein LOC117610900 [Osmia lignaria]